MTLILFSTTDLEGRRGVEFAQLLISIERNVRNGADVRLYVLLQNCASAKLAKLRKWVPPYCRLTAVAGRCSLSTARNRLIAAALAEAVPDNDDVIGFPDDDCWYPDHVGTSLADTFATLPDLDVLICRVKRQPDDEPIEAEEVRQAAVREVVRLTTSNSMFVRGSVFLRVGEFDPDLRPVRIHLVGDDRREAGRRPLAEFDMLDDHADRVVGQHPDEGVGSEGRPGGRQRPGAAHRQHHSDREPGSRQESAAVGFDRGHAGTFAPAAASFMAWRMRT